MVVGYDSFRNKSIQTTDQKCDVSIIWLGPMLCPFNGHRLSPLLQGYVHVDVPQLAAAIFGGRAVPSLAVSAASPRVCSLRRLYVSVQ